MRRALLLPFLQNLIGYSVVATGFATAPSGTGSMLAMTLAGQLLKRFQSRVLIATGFGISAFSLWQMSGYTFDMSEGVVKWTNFRKASDSG